MKVRYTRPALAELASILDYISQASPAGAKRVQERLQRVIGLLKDQPNIGVRTDDPTIRRVTTVPYPFLVLYEVTADEVIIHAIRHGARDPSGMPGSK